MLVEIHRIWKKFYDPPPPGGRARFYIHTLKCVFFFKKKKENEKKKRGGGGGGSGIASFFLLSLFSFSDKKKLVCFSNVASTKFGTTPSFFSICRPQPRELVMGLANAKYRGPLWVRLGGGGGARR